MMIFEQIKKDMVKAMKTKDPTTANILKVLIADIQRDPNKDYSDQKVIKCIQKTIKSLDEMIKAGNQTAQKEKEILEQYLPKKVTKDEILEFVQTIDFSKLKNKMQAIGIVMKHFPPGTVDGNKVKQIIQNL